jgi:uncharacterized protein YdiU (UPF0061 family)
MKRVNPITIARNHQIERVISLCEQGNDELFFKYLVALQNPFAHESHGQNEFQSAPLAHERVAHTFCGT